MVAETHTFKGEERTHGDHREASAWKKGGREQRADRRFQTKLQVWVWLQGAVLPTRVKALNLSAGGILLEMLDPPPVGTSLRLELQARRPADGRRGQALRANAEIVRVKPAGEGDMSQVGLRFVKLPESLKALLNQLGADERTFGDYRIEALLGRGGMAEVYRATARGADHLFEQVALKRIRHELSSDPKVRALFTQECALLTRLDHPNIVKVYEVGSRDDCLYLVMELIEGSDLETLLKACRKRRVQFPIDFACYVVHTCALALSYAHQASDAAGQPMGLVHRDVSPSNVFVSKLGVIKLGDFGVALMRGMEGSDAGRRAAELETNALVGRRAYMAPELLRGAEASPATDVYALGVLLFELLCLTHPQKGQGSARAHRPEISEALDRVVIGCLSERLAAPPKDRAANASEPASRSLRERLFGRSPRPRRPRTALALAESLQVCFDPAIGNQLAIAALVRGLISRSAESEPRPARSK